MGIDTIEINLVISSSDVNSGDIQLLLWNCYGVSFKGDWMFFMGTHGFIFVWLILYIPVL